MEALDFLYNNLLRLIKAPMNVGSRWFIGFIFLHLLVAAFAFWLNYLKPASEKFTWKKFFSFAFPKYAWTGRSAVLDYKIFVTDQILFTPAFLMYAKTLSASITLAVSAYLTTRFPSSVPSAPPTFLMVAAATAVYVLIDDFCYYLNHLAYHKIPLLWKFHRVHHSADALNPITFRREHPLFTLTNEFFTASVVGVIQGIYLYATSTHLELVTILKTNYLAFLTKALFMNLYHTHIWLSFGPVFGKIFVSPAFHQVHHSSLDRHVDKNYAPVFAIWDYLFGTYYEVGKREELHFGIREPWRHEGLLMTFARPFYEIVTGKSIQPESPPAQAPGEDKSRAA